MDPPRDLEWGELGFKYTRTSFLVFVKWTTETKAWSEPYVRPYAPLELEPSAGELVLLLRLETVVWYSVPVELYVLTRCMGFVVR